MAEPYPPTLAAAQARIAAVRPSAYARTRNAIDGAVSGLSPYITHGLVSPGDVLAGVAAMHELAVQHKFVYELGWRAYFRHVWQHRGEDILRSLHDGPLPEAAYAAALPADIRQGCTDVPAINEAVQTLYATGMLHNHARMWLASYVVHLRKVHWRCGADWLYGHLLDGDLASNHLSWQWVASTGSVIDASYESLDRLTRQPKQDPPATTHQPSAIEPSLLGEPPSDLGTTAADPAMVKGREVWLVHPWNLGSLPASPQDTLVLGLFVGDFHSAWPWSDRRWGFVDARMVELTSHRWHDNAAAIGAALAGARRVRSVDEPHLAPWLARWAECIAAPALLPQVSRRCDSFSQWWYRASRGLQSAADLLAVNKVPAW